jgi:hypothetical protein
LELAEHELPIDRSIVTGYPLHLDCVINGMGGRLDTMAPLEITWEESVETDIQGDINVLRELSSVAT